MVVREHENSSFAAALTLTRKKIERSRATRGQQRAWRKSQAGDHLSTELLTESQKRTEKTKKG
jgi:hypothetical protein